MTKEINVIPTITHDKTKGQRYENTMDEIVALIKGKVPIVWVLTHEETRFIDEFDKRVGKDTNRQLWQWSAYEGFKILQPNMTTQRATGDEKDTWNPIKALTRITEMPMLKATEGTGICYIMRDMHICLNEQVVRQIRDIYGLLIGHAKTLVIVSPILAHGQGGRIAGLPPTLEKQVCVVNYELPTHECIYSRIEEILDHMRLTTNSHKNIGTKLNYSNDDIISFAKALRGLTLTEVDNAIATSITHLQCLHVNKLLNEKKQILRKSDILEFIDTDINVDDIGGLDLAKKYLNRYGRAQEDEAKAFGVEPLKGIILAGIPGCLSGDTSISFFREKRTNFKNLSLEELYRKFNNLELNNSWNIELPTYLHSFDGKSKLVKNRILGILDSGVKQTIVITCITGESITLTGDHPVCTASGKYILASDLVKGQNILYKGSMNPCINNIDKLNIPDNRRMVEVLDTDTTSNFYSEISNFTSVPYALLVIEAHMNALSIDRLIDIAQKDIIAWSALTHLDKKYNVHHIDGDPLNDNIENLMILEYEAHIKLQEEAENSNIDYLREIEIESIEIGNKIQTYDIQMQYPYNNFVANGFVVHNCGKSLFAKTIGKMWKVPLLRLDIGKVMAGIVGSSENKMRMMIDQVEAMAPCVTGDTMISTTSHGNLTIKQIHNLTTSINNEKVIINTLDPLAEESVSAEIYTVIRRPAKDKKLLEFTMATGNIIKVTENHKFLVRNGKELIWREARSLKTGDDLVESNSL